MTEVIEAFVMDDLLANRPAMVQAAGWVVCRVVPAREYRARDWALARGAAAWLPECIERNCGRRWVATKKLPLFPGYLFVGEGAPWPDLLASAAFLPSPIIGTLPPRQAAALAAMVAAGPLPVCERFAEGQAVRLVGGMWDGWRGLYVARASGRVKILLDIFGRSTETLLSEALVEPA